MDEYTTRELGKAALRGALRDLCAPGDHHPDCPRRGAVCPHVGGGGGE